MSLDINKYCAEKLKRFRLSKNLTQKELAEDLGITQQQVARYENNLRMFKQDFLFQLAEYFNVSINDFFPPLERNDEVYKQILRDKGLMDENDNINEEDFKKLIDFAVANKDFIIKKDKD
jgi:repressor LexA